MKNRQQAHIVSGATRTLAFVLGSKLLAAATAAISVLLLL